MKTKEELIAEDVAQFLIEANLDLYNAEKEEAYEACSAIQTTIDIFLLNEALFISSYKTGYTTNQIIKILRDNNDYIAKNIRENMD